MKKIMGIILTVTGIVTAAISLISQISVSVIGGADGPTSISVAGRLGAASAIIMIVGIALLIVGIFMIARTKFKIK